MRIIGDNDLRWFAARLSIATEEVRRSGKMSVHEMKEALKAIPGAESLTMGHAPNGNELVTIAGRTIEVSPGTSVAEIEAAFAQESGTPFPPATAIVTPLPPPVAYNVAPTIPPQTRTTKSMSTPAPGGFAASIRAMMNEARAGIEQAKADGLAQVKDAVGKLNDAKDATAHVAGSMAKAIHDEAADVLAELGQVSNDLGV